MKTFFATLIMAFAPASLLASSPDESGLDAVRVEFSREEMSAARLDPRAFTIDPASVRVELVARPADAAAADAGKSTIGSIVTIVNIANKIWKIIQKNAPVVDAETKYAAAVPRGAASPNELCEWKGPETYEYSFRARNLYGADVVKVSYKLIYSHGGKFEGKGAYLTGVTIVPGAIDVSWGYKLEMSAFVADTTLTNVGTYEDPVAALQLKLSSRITSVLKEWDGNSVYLISGDGKMKEIVSPFSAPKGVGDVSSALPLLEPERVFGF